MVHDGSVMIGSLLKPVGTVPCTALDKSVLSGNLVGEIILGGTLNLICLVDYLHVLLGVQRSNTVGVGVLEAVVSVIDNLLAAACLTLLGVYQDNAVGGTGTVDGA